MCDDDYDYNYDLDDDDYDWDDYCDECRGYGDDYYMDEEGNDVCRCSMCPHSSWYDDWND